MRTIRIKHTPRCCSVGVLPASDMFGRDDTRITPCPTLYLEGDYVNRRPSRSMVKHTSTAAFTINSRRRMSAFLTTCQAEYTGMVTLTCPLEHVDGRQWKEAQARFLSWAWASLTSRQKLKDPEPSLFWFLEFQENGRPHTHVLINGWLNKSALSEKWASYWADIYAEGLESYEMTPYLRFKAKAEFLTKAKLASTRVEMLKKGHAGAGQYAMKYAMKDEQKNVPSGFGWVGRFWGVVGNRKKHVAVIHNSPEFDENMPIINDALSLFWLKISALAADCATIATFRAWKYGCGVTVYQKSQGVKWDDMQAKLILALHDFNRWQNDKHVVVVT